MAKCLLFHDTVNLMVVIGRMSTYGPTIVSEAMATIVDEILWAHCIDAKMRHNDELTTEVGCDKWL